MAYEMPRGHVARHLRVYEMPPGTFPGRLGAYKVVLPRVAGCLGYAFYILNV